MYIYIYTHICVCVLQTQVLCKQVKTMCNTEICYFIYKLSPSSVVKYEYMQLQDK